MKRFAAALFVFCHICIFAANTYAADSQREDVELNAMVKEKTLASAPSTVQI